MFRECLPMKFVFQSIALLLAMVPWTATAAVRFEGGFEMGTVEAYGYTFNPQQWSYITTPAPAFGLKSARVELKNGVFPIYNGAPFMGALRSTTGIPPSQFGFPNRTDAFEGVEQFYGFSFRYNGASTYHPSADYLVMLWESIEPYEQMMRLKWRDGRMRFSTLEPGKGETDRWDAAVSAGAWHRFRLRVKWSADAAVGSATLWLDGAVVVDNVKFANIRKDANGNALQNQIVLGLYLEQGKITDDDTKTAIAFFDEIRVGTTLDDVSPVVPIVDAGVPDSGTPPKPDAGKPDSGQVVDSGAGGGGAGGGAGGGGNGGGGADPMTGGGGGGGDVPGTAGGDPAVAGGGSGGMATGPGVTTGVRSTDTSCGCNSSSTAWLVACAGLLVATRRRRR
jgi:Polysaccharide lyase